MITRLLSQKLALLVIGLAAGSGILIPASYGSFHPVTSSEIQDGTIQTVDLAGNAVTSAKIRDATITDHDLAADSVGANELKGVTKLLFAQCTSNSATVAGRTPGYVFCSVPGADADDSAMVTLATGNNCFLLSRALAQPNSVQIEIFNECGNTQTFSSGLISVIVFDK